ncbi:PepSY-associated TM helix domain-containing protein [Paracoccus cavernae]|uniref:PepSY-associated TM helix domain-containing protein n=1 Tax=Paracoccus cavernae TaxID=1571207 RepID=A0ABT8DFU4_9RHOB|nr:PepSY-associated TM helix domain-containing protein [Paracoccus cavernae]
MFALRPAPTPADTTRVMFSDPALGPSETRAIFVDPFTLAVKGDMVAYGTSGILPFRTAIDYFHRNLMLGEWGRYYSELAASWLWVATLGGVWLWATGRRRARPVNQLPKAQRLRWIHSMIGVSIAVVLLFLSVTGLTWSQAAGRGSTRCAASWAGSRPRWICRWTGRGWRICRG